MKHIVTLSLVFFSLTQLAQAERLEAVKLLTEGYCNKQAVTEVLNLGTNQLNHQKSDFLSYKELTLLGTIAQANSPKYQIQNHIVTDLAITKKPKNNSP